MPSNNEFVIITNKQIYDRLIELEQKQQQAVFVTKILTWIMTPALAGVISIIVNAIVGG